jgi:HD superfamily phosphohydrolase YqeK
MPRPVPDAEQCRALWDEYHTPSNVRLHCALVRDVAVRLGADLQERGQTVDLAVVEAAALLHDWLRFVGVQDIQLKHFKEAPTMEDLEYWRNLNMQFPGLSHSQAAAAELKRLDYPQPLIDAVARHDFSSIIDPEKRPRTWEEKLIYYADKRSLHDTLVTLKARFEDGAARYPEFSSRPGQQLKIAAAFELEKEIFDIVGGDPERLGETPARS